MDEKEQFFQEFQLTQAEGIRETKPPLEHPENCYR